jgi:hypothetical protein
VTSTRFRIGSSRRRRRLKASARPIVAAPWTRKRRSRTRAGRARARVDHLVHPVEGGVEHRAAALDVLGREEGRLAAGAVQPGEGKVDPADPLAVGLEVLEVVEDLEGGAERVGGRVRLGPLAVQAEQEAADGIGGAGAVMEKLGPIGVAGHRRVLPESVEHQARLREPGAVLGRGGVQRGRCRHGRVPGEERPLHRVETRQLLLRRKVGRIGDVVRRAHEAVEGQHRPPFRARQGEGGDGKILVAIRLGAHRLGAGGRSGGHGAPLAG